MDDIQLIVYLIIGVIYIISRALRNKKKQEAPPTRPSKSPQSQAQPPKKTAPTSFEDILQEFGKRMGEQQNQGRVEEPTPIEVLPEPEPEIVEPVVKQFDQEGSSRQFADAESRRVYEESIALAEGAELEFEANQKYSKPGLKMGFDAYEKDEEENVIAGEIKEMLQNPNSAKKAIILSEILNRKY